MKKFLLGAAAALAIAAPGVASAQQSGYVDLGYTSTDASGGGDIDTWTFGGATAWGGNGSLGFQIDGQYGSHDAGAFDADTYNLGGHIFTRSDGGLIGGFVNFGSADFGGAFDYDYWTIGGEGAIYMTRTTLNGVISYSDSEDLDAQITALDVGATHFVTDNFSFGGNFAIGDIEGGSEFWSAGLGTEFQFSSAPISLFGGYTHTDFDGTDVDALTVGVRYNWGGSLFERDRSGASLTRNAGFGRLGAIL